MKQPQRPTGCKPLTESDVDAMIKMIDKNRHARRDRAFIVLGLRTGFRVSELLSLTIGDVWKNGWVVDTLEVPQQNMKGKRRGRSVVLTDDAKEAIIELIEYLVEEGLLFPDTYLFRSQKGSNKAITREQANGILHRAARAAGVTGKVGTHSLRKTFAADIHEVLGRDIFNTMDALGLIDCGSASHYIPYRPKDVTKGILALPKSTGGNQS